MMTDPIADMLTRLRNTSRAGKLVCEMPASNVKESILKLFKEAGYIKSVVREEQSPQDKLVVTHKFLGKNLKPVLNHLKRVSKPGCRVYRGYQELRPLLGGIGLVILSTPKGIMTDAEARKQKLGGEILCEVW